jgi:hypothetical protein
MFIIGVNIQNNPYDKTLRDSHKCDHHHNYHSISDLNWQKEKEGGTELAKKDKKKTMCGDVLNHIKIAIQAS